MNVYYITLERIRTGEQAGSMVTRQASEDAARSYAQDAIRQANRKMKPHDHEGGDAADIFDALQPLAAARYF